jgi:hypothetical protein
MILVHPMPPPPPPHPPRSEPDWFDQEFAGIPIWGHVLLTVCTVGIWLLIVPFVWLYHAAQLAFAKMVVTVLAAIVAAVVFVLKAPARALYRQVRRLSGRRP